MDVGVAAHGHVARRMGWGGSRPNDARGVEIVQIGPGETVVHDRDEPASWQIEPTGGVPKAARLRVPYQRRGR